MIFTTSYNPYQYSSPWISFHEIPRRRNSCAPRNARRCHGYPLAAEQPDLIPSLLFMKLLSETLDNEQQQREGKNQETTTTSTKPQSEEEKLEGNDKEQPTPDGKTTSSQRTIYQRPMVNVHEDDQKVVLSLDVPGYDMNGLEVMLTNNDTVLVVSGEKANRLLHDEKYVFRRRFRVNPLNLKKSSNNGAPVITAELSLGVLTITTLKNNKPPETRTIEITSQRPGNLQVEETTNKVQVTSDEVPSDIENESAITEGYSIDVDDEQTSLAPEDVQVETVSELEENNEDAASIEDADESTARNESGEWEEVVRA